MDVLVIRQKVILDAMLCLNFAESEHLTSYYISELECYANRSFDDEFISNKMSDCFTLLTCLFVYTFVTAPVKQELGRNIGV